MFVYCHTVVAEPVKSASPAKTPVHLQDNTQPVEESATNTEPVEESAASTEPVEASTPAAVSKTEDEPAEAEVVTLTKLSRFTSIKASHHTVSEVGVAVTPSPFKSTEISLLESGG